MNASLHLPLVLKGCNFIAPLQEFLILFTKYLHIFWSLSAVCLQNILFTFIVLAPPGWAETDYQKAGTWADTSRIDNDEFSKRASRSLNLDAAAWLPL